MTPIRLVSLGLVLLAACGELSRNPGTDAGPGSSRTPCDGCETAELVCLAGECRGRCQPGPGSLACLPSEQCFLGTCVDSRAPTCDENACNAAQTCVSTYCVVVTTKSCTAKDGCRLSETCPPSLGVCVSAPPCNEDGSCHLGTLGAVCNRTADPINGLSPGTLLGACLIGRCTRDDHCPLPLTCQDLGAEIEGLGVCR